MASHPKILDIRTIATGKFFKLQHVDLQFNNQQVTFERVSSKLNNGAVFIIATTENELVLIKEYMTGTERYELSLPKGAIDDGESPEEAGKRELIEETGFHAKSTSLGRKVFTNTAYMTSFSYYVFAQDLTAGEALGGDEVEPLEVILWPLNQLNELVNSSDIMDARSLLGIHLLINSLPK